jgi:hypothetical protein
MSIQGAMGIPELFSAESKPFKEEKLIMVYRECPLEVKDLFLQTIVKPEHLSKDLSLLMSVSVMAIEVQWVYSLLTQILGLDNDKNVVDVMLGFLLSFCQSESIQSVYINFDKFIIDNIHKQLVNFESLKHFRYYTYLMKIFLETNKREFPEVAVISNECKRITLLIFINKVMSSVYSLIFKTILPRVLDDMRIYL